MPEILQNSQRTTTSIAALSSAQADESAAMGKLTKRGAKGRLGWPLVRSFEEEKGDVED